MLQIEGRTGQTAETWRRSERLLLASLGQNYRPPLRLLTGTVHCILSICLPGTAKLTRELQAVEEKMASVSRKIQKYRAAYQKHVDRDNELSKARDQEEARRKQTAHTEGHEESTRHTIGTLKAYSGKKKEAFP